MEHLLIEIWYVNERHLIWKLSLTVNVCENVKKLESEWYTTEIVSKKSKCVLNNFCKKVGALPF